MMNRANTIATIRTRDESTLFDPSMSLSASPFYSTRLNSSSSSRNQGYRQPTRALRISNPDNKLIEGESDSSDDSPPPVQKNKNKNYNHNMINNNNFINSNYSQQQQQQQQQYYNAPLSPSNYQPQTPAPAPPPQPLKMNSLPIKPETIEQQQEVEEEQLGTQNVTQKVPLKIITNYHQQNRSNALLPSSEFANSNNGVNDTEHQQDNVEHYIPDCSTLTSPLPFNHSTSILSGSNNNDDPSLLNKPKTSTHLATEFAHQNNSKYAKVSYQLTNNPTIIKMYREAAEKTNHPETQLLFAKYLLETAALFSADSNTAHHSSAASNRHANIVVGSMWGISPTRKSTIPKPFHVVQSDELGSSQGSTANNNTSASSSLNQPPMSNRFSINSKTTTVNVYQQQASLQLLTSPRYRKRDLQDALENKSKSDILEEEGVKWIKKLSKQHEPEACYILGKWIAQEKHGMKYNRQKLTFEYEVAAKGGIPEAMYELAMLYEQDKQNPSTFLKLYVDSSNRGYVNAIFRLSIGTLYGEMGLRQSTTEALKLMHKAAEYSSEEFSEPCYIFGLMLMNEYPGSDISLEQRQVYKGKEAAVLYLDRAARLGNQKAQAKLGSIYEHGSFGETMNFAKAFDYYNSAALQGNPKAMLGLCRLNMRGSHGPRDTSEAERLEKDVSGWLAATPVDEDAAFEWCKRAADLGYSEALAMLGWFYESGFGTPRDMAMADRYYALAANCGNKGAKQRLDFNTSTTKQQHSHIQENRSSKIKSNRRKSTFGSKTHQCFCM